MSEMERWRQVCGFDGRYEVSSAGRVRSFVKPIMGGVKWLATPHFLNPKTDRGYLRVCLSCCNNYKTYSVARLVLTAFIGPCPEGMEGAHLNGDRGDNRIENLSWVTHTVNESHKSLHGTRLFGSRICNSKLTEAQVEDIIARLRSGERGTALAKEYGVADSSISSIGLGQTWSHVNGARQTSTNRGTKNGRAKLSDQEVRLIRKLAGSVSDIKIANDFGVCAETVRRIRIGSHWRSVA